LGTRPKAAQKQQSPDEQGFDIQRAEGLQPQGKSVTATTVAAATAFTATATTTGACAVGAAETTAAAFATTVAAATAFTTATTTVAAATFATTTVTAAAFTATAVTTATAFTAATEAAAAITTAAAFTATAAKAATTTEAAAARTWGTCFHRTCFVHDHIAAAQRLTVHAIDRSLRFVVAAHFHEAEAFGAASVAFHHDFGAGHSTEFTESLFQIAVANRVRQVADVKFVAHERDSSKHRDKSDGAPKTHSTNLKTSEGKRN
jgi:hypothetical protein